MTAADRERWTAAQRRRALLVPVAAAGLVASAAPVVWWESQDTPGDRTGWLLAAGAALVALLATARTVVNELSDRDYAAAWVGLLTVPAFALGTVFAAAQTAHAVDAARHEPRRVAATTVDCRVTGRSVDDQNIGHDLYGCTYRWFVDDHEFREERPTRKLYADGRETSVWLDGNRMITERPSGIAIPFWGATALAAFVCTVMLAMIVRRRARGAGLVR
ncbi:hypothetical protein OG196_03285 [Kitasatospora purpeofusca]|uniref:hypothetical protein n=1 Tax=Kitasatospora purpeofusca TaxID=67352 RepID=UPI002E157BA2|nr:hypothetical protein OG715_02705 [Kitasatospora purpeofusca]WSR38178.1 hypothetical protein OG196_03285 [Kitasatospora purpeofusca]